MNLKFEERPYAGKTFRPRPEILLDEQLNLLIVATPWGARTAARKVIDRMTDYLALAREDNEATSPFERLSCLSTQANNLRVATLLANESIYREDNQQEYHSGVELFAAIVDDNEFVWIQAGNPQILLKRAGRSPFTLSAQIDLAADLSHGEGLLPPMPSQLLGLDLSLNLNLNSFRVRTGDQIILLSHSHPPQSLFSLKSDDVSLDSVSKVLAVQYPDIAFWLGLLSITDPSADPVADSSTDSHEGAGST